MSKEDSLNSVTAVSAVAGAGKTSLLVEICNATKPKSGLYLAYNKSVATEAQQRFPKSVSCSTTHSLAWRSVVKQYSLKVGNFSYRSMPSSIPYSTRCNIVDHIRQFCLSEHVDFNHYSDEFELDPKFKSICNKYLDLMGSGSIECSHDFYLKMFHILLVNGSIEFPEFDLLALDEAGDLNKVTFEIFKAIKAKRKLMCGDASQNIYVFNHTINCFKAVEGTATFFPMSQSFRVSSKIASRIEAFQRKYVDSNFNFKGIPDDPSMEIKSRAYISSTNSGLIAKMISLNKLDIPYALARKADEIFKLPLILMSIKPRGFIGANEFKFLQTDFDEWNSSRALKLEYKSALAYIKSEHPHDIQLQTAIGILFTYGSVEVMECYKHAKKHASSKQSYVLGTAFVFKGAEFDEVEIAPDLNKATGAVLELVSDGVQFDQLLPEHQAILNLYYVATTRARHSLLNADLLDI